MMVDDNEKTQINNIGVEQFAKTKGKRELFIAQKSQDQSVANKYFIVKEEKKSKY